MTARASGKPGAGSNSEGGKMKTPSVPVNAAVSEAGFGISARAISQPCDAQKGPFSISRTTARTGRRSASRARASAPPTFPVIPVIAYIVILLVVLAVSGEDTRAALIDEIQVKLFSFLHPSYLHGNHKQFNSNRAIE